MITFSLTDENVTLKDKKEFKTNKSLQNFVVTVYMPTVQTSIVYITFSKLSTL